MNRMNVYDSKIDNFVACVREHTGTGSTIDEAIDIARKLEQEQMDSAQLDHGEKRARRTLQGN